MALLAWKDAYSVKINEIDEQHKKLVAMLNELHDAMVAQQGKDALGKILQQLVGYCVSHFAAEERLMKTNDYPGFAEHKDKHEKMTAKVKALQAELASGKKTITIDVMNFLKDWLDKHILGTDKLYSPFLTAKGVK